MIVQKNFLKIVICIVCIHFIILCLRPNVMSQIGKSKIYGAVDVPELKGCLGGWRDEWEWMGALETMGASSIDYQEEYLRKNVESVSLLFFYDTVDYCDINDFNIYIEVNLSETDQTIMELEMRYDYEKKELIYEPVYILQGEWDNIEEYTDEKSIDECLNRYGLTRKDVQKYQDYAIYGVVVKTWTKAHKELYWVERWKLKRKVVDKTFQFEELESEEKADLEEY